jgi:hypothetical protein
MKYLSADTFTKVFHGQMLIYYLQYTCDYYEQAFANNYITVITRIAMSYVTN